MSSAAIAPPSEAPVYNAFKICVRGGNLLISDIFIIFFWPIIEIFKIRLFERTVDTRGV